MLSLFMFTTFHLTHAFPVLYALLPSMFLIPFHVPYIVEKLSAKSETMQKLRHVIFLSPLPVTYKFATYTFACLR